MANTIHDSHLWDALVGQPGALDSLRQIAEQGTPPGGNRLIFSGPNGTGKTTATNLLAAALHETAPIATHGAYLKGLSPARAYQQLQNLVARNAPAMGVLVIDGAGELVQHSTYQGARAAVVQLLSQFPGITTILVDHNREIDNLTDRHEQIGELFTRRITFPTLDPSSIRVLAERSAQRHGLRIDSAAGRLIEAVAAQLALQTTPEGSTLLDRLGNGWLASAAVRTASRVKNHRLGLGDSVQQELTNEQLTIITADEMRAGLGTAIASGP